MTSYKRWGYWGKRGLDQQGLTLVEMLIAVGVGTIILSAMMTMFSHQAKMQQNLSSGLDFSNMYMEIQSVLSRPELCKAALLTSAGGVAKLNGTVGGASLDFHKITAPYGDIIHKDQILKGLKFSTLDLRTTIDLGGGEYRASLVVVAEKSSQIAVGSPTRNMPELPLAVRVNAANEITECQTIARESAGGDLPEGTEGQTLFHDGTEWKATDFLYNNESRIGIATKIPLTKLDVRSATPKATTAALERLFQVGSADNASPLALTMGVRTHAQVNSRHAAIEVTEGATPATLALQPSGGAVVIGGTWGAGVPGYPAATLRTYTTMTTNVGGGDFPVTQSYVRNCNYESGMVGVFHQYFSPVTFSCAESLIAEIGAVGSGWGGGDLVFKTTTNPPSSSQERMRINAGGNVRISGGHLSVEATAPGAYAISAIATTAGMFGAGGGIQAVGPAMGVYGRAVSGSGIGVRGENPSLVSGWGVYCAGFQCGGNKAWTNASDQRMKTDISTIEDPIEKVLGLRGVTFKWRENSSAGTQMGFIAQEAENIVPEVVSIDKETGRYHMQYGPLTALVVEAVKNQQEAIDRLRAENQVLQRENAAIKAYLCAQDPSAAFCAAE